MSRLEIASPKRAKIVMEGLYKDLERRIESSPPGLCPVDMARAFLELCHAQTCGKCVDFCLQFRHKRCSATADIMYSYFYTPLYDIHLQFFTALYIIY